MIVPDRARALDCLDRIGYYRLSGYWHDFRLRPAFCPLDEQAGGKPKKVDIERLVLDEFKPGTRFQDAVAARTGKVSGSTCEVVMNFPSQQLSNRC